MLAVMFLVLSGILAGGGQLAAMMAWPGFEPNYWPALVLIDGTISY